MGEAKRRKQSEPNFGRIPKNPGYRGLVVSPPIEIEGTRLYAKSSSLDPQELRFALLFWDRLVWPSSRAIFFGSNVDEEFLESAGILSRPEYTFNGDMAQGIAKSQIQAYLDRESAEPGTWALAQGENSFLLKENLVEEGAGVLVELHRAIPVPQHDVPLVEILEFKERRRDELILLRHQLESFVSEIEGSAERALTLQKRVAEIDQACSNLLVVGKEWQFPIYLSNIKASFNLTPVKSGPFTYAGWKMGEPYGLVAATVAAGVAGLLSTFEIKGDFGLRSKKRPINPYRYAYQIHKELS
ncbi:MULTISPECIES: DUF6236 family protein [Nitrosomonas]|uniref:Uncharacterized protein n=1 Tax=Nitrosomonas communis TaxID=44574 RepID=A0A0F7KFE2_9PROT|nr:MULTISPECIES: DUF6236 family protein [Nitrosomonas]AKH38211.1 hypothetical protein AAW31_11100 [Nitrosomonas communis]TYP77433.1 hypothetical protein BCL69_10798 [Nitrosomonas communis]UVS60183.1 DUF6236 family protein [Nitrosomonas sp. PLL12]